MTEQETHTPRGIHDAPRSKKRRPRPLLVVIGSIIVVIVLIVLADVITRNVIENRAASRIEESLPNHVHADVSVHLAGFSALAQLMSGKLDHLTITSTDATVEGIPLGDIRIVAQGVPTAAGKPLESATATATISEQSLNKFLSRARFGGSLTLRQDGVGYTNTIDVLGFPLQYSATAKPRADGDRVELTPDATKLSSSAGSLTLTPLVQALAARGPITVCVAPYLPNGVRVTGIQVGFQTATVTLAVSHPTLTEIFWTSRGSCS